MHSRLVSRLVPVGSHHWVERIDSELDSVTVLIRTLNSCPCVRCIADRESRRAVRSSSAKDQRTFQLAAYPHIEALLDAISRGPS